MRWGSNPGMRCPLCESRDLANSYSERRPGKPWRSLCLKRLGACRAHMALLVKFLGLVGVISLRVPS